MVMCDLWQLYCLVSNCIIFMALAIASTSSIISGNRGKYFRGARYYFQGAREFLLISDEGFCETTKNLDCNSLMIHNGLRNKTYIYTYRAKNMALKILTF